METNHSSESNVSNAGISARAEALEKLEEAKATAPEKKIEEKDPEADTSKADTGKAAAEKVEADKKAPEAVAKKPAKDKKDANDPDEMRKWNTRAAQENSKLKKEMELIKEAQEKTYKLLASLSKKPVDYKELAKNPENLEKFIESERQALTSEYQEQLNQLTSQAKEKDTIVERMRREQDTVNYPDWKRLYPAIIKIAVGPTGQGDPRVDFTKPASEVLDHLYSIALQENPEAAAPVVTEKTFTEAEMKAMVSDMVSKERESITAAARDNAAKEAQDALRREAAGSTVASAGKGASRVPTDHLSAFKKMSLGEQRDWLIAQRADQ
jgi:hypothetical protein